MEGKPGTVSEPSAPNGGNTDAEGTGLTGYPNSSGTGRRGGLYSYGFETGCPEPGSRTQRTERENSLQSGACSGIYFSQADPFAEGTGAFSLQGKDQPAESGRSLPESQNGFSEGAGKEKNEHLEDWKEETLSVQIESWRREKSGLEKSYEQVAEAFRECNTRFTALQSAVSTLREQNKEAELLSEPEILACKAVLSEKKRKSRTAEPAVCGNGE